MHSETARKQDIERSVREQFDWDASVDGSNIIVNVSDSTIVLSGSVPAYRDRQHAALDAQAVAGPMTVDNQLVISYPGETTDTVDADLALRVKVSLASGMDVDISKIGIAVKSGNVTLSGCVYMYRQKLRAAELAANINGVTAVKNRICVVPGGSERDEALANGIVSSLAHHGNSIDIDAMDIEVNGGLVTLYGAVESNESRHQAEKLTHEAGEIVAVDNRLIIL
jgi:osmotically-inducible protein OsmY